MVAHAGSVQPKGKGDLWRWASVALFSECQPASAITMLMAYPPFTLLSQMSKQLKILQCNNGSLGLSSNVPIFTAHV